MKPMKSCILFIVSIAAILIPTAVPQTPVGTPSPCLQQACFFATTSATLAGSAATTLTVQQPATGTAHQINFIAVVAQCSGQAFSVDQSQNGTAATTTAGSTVGLIPIIKTAAGAAVTSTANVFTASNVGSGTATAPTLAYTAGDPHTIGLADRSMSGTGNTQNYSIKVTNNGSASCTGAIAIYWYERI